MDFQSLSRRDLQALCKKNRIPANMTNVAMADALQALQTVEGIEEIKEATLFQSPAKANMRSPNLLCTSRRTSLRRAPVPDESEGNPGSPLPRARRVAIKASEIMKLVSEPEEIPKTPAARTGTKPQAAPSTRRRARKKEQKEPQEEEQKQEDALKEIPKTPAASTARNTRRRASRKEEAESHEGPLEVALTPATRYGRRASIRKGDEAPMAGKEKQEEAAGFRTTSRTRQSVRKRMEETTLDAAPGGGRRTTRAKAPVKMAALAQEEDKKYITAEDLIDQNNHSLQIPDEKSVEVLMEEHEKNGAISDPCSRDSEMKNDGPDDGVQDSSTDGSDNGTTQETNNCTLMWNNLGTEAEGEQISEEEVPEEEGGQQEDDVLSRLDESPIRGLVSSENNQQINQEQEETLDGTPAENPTVTDGGSEDECRGGETLDFALPDPSFSNEIKPNGEESGHHLPETQAAGDLPLVQEILAVELHGEIEATRDQIPEYLIQSKEEEVSLNLLPIGKSLEETKVSGNELPVDLAPETETSSSDLQGNSETEDSPAKFLYDIPAAETNNSSDSFDIPEDTEESGAGITISGTGGTAPKPKISIDLHFNLDTGNVSADLYRRILATETNDSGDVVELPKDTEESGVDILIGKQTAPDPESVLQAAASSRLQQSPSPFLIVQSSDDTGSPSKILALDGDHIGDLALSNVGSPAKISAQVGDITECALESRTESSAKTVGELGDLTGDFTDSDLVTGAPVATPPDHGGYESDGNGIVLEVEGGEEESKAIDTYVTGSGGGDDNKENWNGSLPSGLTLVEVGGDEGRVKSKAEKPIQPDHNSLSMGKLKAIPREKASNLTK